MTVGSNARRIFASTIYAHLNFRRTSGFIAEQVIKCLGVNSAHYSQGRF